MWEKYLAERVLPGFGVSCKNDRKCLTYGFGVKFLRDAELSHQLSKLPSRLAGGTVASTGGTVASTGGTVTTW